MRQILVHRFSVKGDTPVGDIYKGSSRINLGTGFLRIFFHRLENWPPTGLEPPAGAKKGEKL